jgi:3-keto-disaccharide hydrolase
MKEMIQNLSAPMIAFVCTFVFASPAFAADTEPAGSMTSGQLRKAGFAPLIEGDSLAAWDKKPWHDGHWTIAGGVINYDGKAKGKRKQQDNSLWTKKSYGDFTLYAEWRLPEKPTMHPTPIVLFNGDFLMDENNKRVTRPQLDSGDSGLMFRGTSKCQANIWCQDLGSGEINGYRTDHKMPQSVRRACIPIKKADRPMGEWNAFLITMKRDRMTVELNGERVINAAELPGVPNSGPIGLQHHGDPVQFRQLWVKTLN